MYQKPAMLTIVPKSNLDFVENYYDQESNNDELNQDKSDGRRITWSQGLPEMEKSQLVAEALPSPLTS